MGKEITSLKKEILQYGKDNGINALGFLKAEPFFRDLERYNYADKKGYLSSFIKKNSELNIVEGFKSVVVVLMSYPNPNYNLPKDPEKELGNKIYGKVSSSSWGKDYHLVLRDVIEKLAEYISNISEMKEYYISVDTSPVSERELAVKAGLGWIGKNSNLINKELGSFVFIGALFTDIEIPGIDNVELSDDFCKDCTICIDSCPVNAIDKNMRVINTNLCLSQQTQEKEVINSLVKEKIKETKYIYGCDICQEVCPWNKKERDFNPLFSPEIEEVFIDLEKLLLETNSSFKSKYGHLAGSWRGKKIWQKNGKFILLNSDS